MTKILGYITALLSGIAVYFKMKADRAEKKNLNIQIANAKAAKQATDKATKAVIIATAKHNERIEDIKDTKLDDFLIKLHKRNNKAD